MENINISLYINITEMDAIIITLLILLVFLISCDSQLLQYIKDMMVSPELAEEEVEVDGYSNYDWTQELELQPEGFLNSRGGPGTWEPSTADFAKLGNDKIYKAYAEDLKANVDRAIIASHQKYTEDTDFLATTGASHASARDDFNPPVQFHGLPRKAHYAQVGAERSSRTAQSETPEAVQEIKEHNSTGYIL